VTANFKESQLRYMRPGNGPHFGGRLRKEIYGHVESIAGASGALFSRAAAGKRDRQLCESRAAVFPVKITFDPEKQGKHILRPGMSVEPKVWVR